ncbi:MAG: hypothetical protein ACRETB_09685 [Steroidobacteraceae bacterium]
MMRRAWQELSALFGSVGPAGRPGVPALMFVLCAALAYPLATEAGYAGAVGGAFVFCVATLILAYSLGAGALAFTVEAKGSCLPGSQRLKRRASVIALLLLLALAVIPAAALAQNPAWEAWVPTALVLGVALGTVLFPLLPVGIMGLLVLLVLAGYWAALGPVDHERNMGLLFALLSTALALPVVTKWRRVVREDSWSPSLARLLRSWWALLRRRRTGQPGLGEAVNSGGFQDHPSPVTVIRTCLGGYFTRQPVPTTILTVIVILCLTATVVTLLPHSGGRWHWSIALVAFLTATLIWGRFLHPLFKLTREDIAELALLPGLGNAATQRRSLCLAVLAPPLPWLAGIFLGSSAGFLLKGEPLSSVRALVAYILIIWLTYAAVALQILVAFAQKRRNRASVIHELMLIYSGVYIFAIYDYFFAIYDNVYGAYRFMLAGQLLWWFWITLILAGIGFACGIGYTVRRLATAPHPFLS